MKFTINKTIGGIGALAFLCASVVSCGRNKTQSKGEKLRQNDFSLDGTWRNECTKFDWLGLTHEKTTFKFSSLGDFDKVTTIYSDEACTVGAAQLVERGTYASLDKAPNVPEATDINFTLVAANLTVTNEDTAKLVNTASYCEFSKWSVGATVDVLGKKCLGQSHTSGDVVFDIYRLDNTKKHLTFGKNQIFLDNNTAASRPDRLNSERVFTKE